MTFPKSSVSPLNGGFPPISSGSRRRRVTTTLDAIALAAFFLPSLAHGATAADLLPPEKAFRFTARALGPASVEARFNVADGYYLYRDKIRIRVDPAEFTRG